MTDQLLPAIRRLADRYGLPDGLEYDESASWVVIVEKPTHAPRVVIEGDAWDPIFTIWLAAFAAHVETEAEQRDNIKVWPHPQESSIIWFHPTSKAGARSEFIPYTPGDTLSRITATLLALDDGATAIGGES